MPMSAPCSRRLARLARLLAGVGLSLVASQVALGKAVPPVISVSEPEGFADLGGPQQLFVDVYFNGARVGSTAVTASRGAVRFEDPAGVAALLSNTRVPELAALLGRALPANEGLGCNSLSDRITCGKLVPDDLGVILDRDRFRLDIFAGGTVAKALLVEPEAYLAEPGKQASLINTVAGIVSGSNGGWTTANLQDSLIVGSGARRLRNDVFYSNRLGFQLDQSVAEWDRKGARLSAGLMATPGVDLIGRRKLLGLGLATQLDTRVDRELLLGSPLMLSLGQRARVEVVRDGRVLASSIFDSGNHAIDTTSLPDGSYEVTLRISEIGAPVREERRFFTRSARVAPLGHDVAFAYAGVAARESSRRFVHATSDPYAIAGYAHRLSASLALDATAVATSKAVVSQLGASYLSGAVQIHAAGLGSSTGAYGAMLQLGSTGTGPLNFALDLRKVRIGAGDTVDGLMAEDYVLDNSLESGLPAVRASGRSFTQVTGYVGYGHRRGQFGVSLSGREERGQDFAFSIGPSARWDVYQRGPARLTFNADANFTERGTSGFLGLTLSLAGLTGSSSNRAGVRFSNFDDDHKRARPVAALAGAYNFAGVASGDLEVGGALERDGRDTQSNLTSRLTTPWMRATADILRANGATQYALGLRSTMVGSGDRVALQSGDQDRSAILVAITGTNASTSYQVLVDEAVVANIHEGDVRSIPVAPYHHYAVRIRPAGSGAFRYDSSSRDITVYPGTVARLSWSSQPLATIFGRLALPDGTPLPSAFIRSGQSVAETDPLGFFQIEAAPRGELVAALPDGNSCEATVPPVSTNAEFSAVGTLTCTTRIGQRTSVVALTTSTRGPQDAK